jgi:hypothetical protein
MYPKERPAHLRLMLVVVMAVGIATTSSSGIVAAQSASSIHPASLSQTD